jgi:hypothetical protein
MRCRPRSPPVIGELFLLAKHAEPVLDGLDVTQALRRRRFAAEESDYGRLVWSPQQTLELLGREGTHFLAEQEDPHIRSLKNLLYLGLTFRPRAEIAFPLPYEHSREPCTSDELRNHVELALQSQLEHLEAFHVDACIVAVSHEYQENVVR